LLSRRGRVDSRSSRAPSRIIRDATASAQTRLTSLQEILEHRTARSAQTLRTILGPIRLDLVTPEIGRPFYRAITTLDALALIETPPGQSVAEGGSNSLQRWTRTRRIRTAAEIPVASVIVDQSEVPVYLRSILALGGPAAATSVQDRLLLFERSLSSWISTTPRRDAGADARIRTRNTATRDDETAGAASTLRASPGAVIPAGRALRWPQAATPARPGQRAA
jgi:hypothetical protein